MDNILEWGNEHSFNAYPLNALSGFEDFLLDASFIQFDYFVPTLKSIAVTPLNVEVVILFDSGLITATTLIGTILDTTSATYRILTLYGANNRYLGALSFGPGLDAIISTYMNRSYTFNIPFSPMTVTGIPKATGVYSINEEIGDVILKTGTTVTEQAINFTIVSQNIAWNALAIPTITSTASLKSINSVTPLNNNISLVEDDLVKIRGTGGGLDIYLAGDTSKLAHTTKYV